MSEPEELVVVQEDTKVEVTKVSSGLTLTAAGPQGIQGPQGLPGAAGGSVYVHTQDVASSTWVINHNVGRAVAVVLYDDGGNVVQSDIEHGTINQATVTWSSPTTGTALVL